MKLSFAAILALAAVVIAAPVPQGSYDDYGDYSNVTPAPPAGGYGNYGDYDVPVDNPPPPAGGYGNYGDYGSYKRDAEAEEKA